MFEPLGDGVLPVSSAAATALSGVMNNRVIAGIILKFAKSATVKKLQLNVNLNLNGKSYAQISALSAVPLVEIADGDAGVGYGETLVTEAMDANVDAATGGDATTQIDRSVCAFIPLGNIHLRGNDSLTVRAVLLSALTSSETIEISWVDGFPGKPEQILQYSEPGNGQNVFQHASRAFIYEIDDLDSTDHRPVSKLAQTDLSVKVEADGKSRTFPATIAFAFDKATRQFEGQGPRRTICVFRNTETFGVVDLSIALTGSERNHYSVLAIQEILMPERVAKTEDARAQEETSKARAIMTKDPSKFKALSLRRS